MAEIGTLKIGNQQKDASRLVLGTWAIGGWMWGGAEEEESVKTIHAALNKGINFIDTAAVYGFGHSEEVVGRAIKEYGNRNEITVATKAGLDWKDGKVWRDSSPDRIKREIEDSLRRLDLEYIDIYFVHWPDPNVKMSETAKTMLHLMEQGLIKNIGVSNFNTLQMGEFKETAPIHVCQPPYNIFERDIEVDVMPYCDKNSIRLMVYGALCRGLLSGKMDKDRNFVGDDLRQKDPKFKEPRVGQYLEAVRLLEEYAHKFHHKHVIDLALRWILDQGAEFTIWGARSPDQLKPASEAFGWTLDGRDMEAIDKILTKTISQPVGPEFMAPPSRP